MNRITGFILLLQSAMWLAPALCDDFSYSKKTTALCMFILFWIVGLNELEKPSK